VRIVIAGGGTGGHLFPGIAIAEEILVRGNNNKIIFIGTKKGIEHRMLGQLGYELQEIDVEGVKGRGLKALMKVIYQIPHSMWQSRQILKRFCPEIVIGVGGYASGPAVVTARIMGIPTAIAEQNAVPGITNRILSKFANLVFVTYAQTKDWFPQSKVIVSGNPVRKVFSALCAQKLEEKQYRQLLIFGGSQGAAAINKNVIAMMPQLQKMKDKLRVLHQTGDREVEIVKQAYEQFGLDAQVTPFIVNMADAYAAADLIICRAGATSLAEITAAGKAAILIPYPWAANDHQTINAEVLESAGAAVMINEHELNGEKLFGVIEDLLANKKKLRQMEEASLKLGNIKAAAKIVDACMELAGKSNQIFIYSKN
jgi:UDP-N-acetylglucosamine--N-acetylmuramyl-(pentapeptide) pyrophosphoryl-undecaprenol N-acetylglucosamine transferase